jgi:hypothetical protein
MYIFPSFSGSGFTIRIHKFIESGSGTTTLPNGDEGIKSNPVGSAMNAGSIEEHNTFSVEFYKIIMKQILGNPTATVLNYICMIYVSLRRFLDFATS